MPLDPFHLAVSHPTVQLILTPSRHSDGLSIVPAMNDRRVYMNLDAPPYPYTQGDWDSWFSFVSGVNATAAREWDDMTTREHTQEQGQDKENQDRSQHREKEKKQEKKWIGAKGWSSTIRAIVQSPDSGFDMNSSEPPEPQSSLRDDDTASGQTEIFIGSIDIRRCGLPQILDAEERKAAVARNNALQAGDPAIVWEVGFYLIPEYQGKGIMPVVLRTLRDRILVPYLNVHVMVGTYFDGNAASKRVFEKCGFSSEGMVEECIWVPESKVPGGKMTGMGVMRWTRDKGLEGENDL